MSLEIKVPVLPESVSDATIATWHKKPGDAVKRDENLVDLETDKVVLEVPAPADGILKSISAETGATVTSGELLGVIRKAQPLRHPLPMKRQPKRRRRTRKPRKPKPRHRPRASRNSRQPVVAWRPRKASIRPRLPARVAMAA